MIIKEGEEYSYCYVKYAPIDEMFVKKTAISAGREVYVGFDIQHDIFCEPYYKYKIWIDLWVEAKQILLTHPDFYCPDPDFLGCLKAFKLLDEFDGDAEEYKHCLEVNDKVGIFKYLNSCVDIYKKLHKKIEEFHIDFNLNNWAYDTVFTHTDTFNRGKYCVTSGLILERNKGFPIHKEMVKLISEKKEDIKYAILMNANKKMGFDVFSAKVKRRPTELTLCLKNLDEYAKSKGVELDTTRKGFIKFNEDEINKYKEELYDFVHVRNIMKQMEAFGLYNKLSPDGYLKVHSAPFHQKTSRSSHMPKHGHILSLAPWIRMLIYPPAGNCITITDFKEQEILVAASLSKDEKMLATYGNAYLKSAIDLGFAPAYATKESHPEIRKLFKEVLLSLMYGGGEYSIAPKFKKHLKLSNKEAVEQAEYMIIKHKQTYKKYWSFVYKNHEMSQVREYYKCPYSGWVYFINKFTKHTQIQNAPIQLAGAEIMRRAKIKAVNDGLNIITDQHDAIVMQSETYEEINEEGIFVLRRIMKEASKEILSNDLMQLETRIISPKEHLYEEKGLEIFNLICDVIGYKPELTPNEIYEENV